MTWVVNAKGSLVSSVVDPVSGKKLGGGCPGMNPWHDGWKLHRLKGSILAHFHLRVLSKAIALISTAVSGAASDREVPFPSRSCVQENVLSGRGARAPSRAGRCLLFSLAIIFDLYFYPLRRVCRLLSVSLSPREGGERAASPLRQGGPRALHVLKHQHPLYALGFVSCCSTLLLQT